MCITFELLLHMHTLNVCTKSVDLMQIHNSLLLVVMNELQYTQTANPVSLAELITTNKCDIKILHA